MNWQHSTFDKLSLQDYHDMLALRIEVFVIEQECPYQEVDGLDPRSIHLWCRDEGVVSACLRIIPPGIKRPECVIGRVVVKEIYRGTGLGHDLMKEGMALVKDMFGTCPIFLSAQEHLRSYYASHGFQQDGDGYLEDGIPHIPMIRG